MPLGIAQWRIQIFFETGPPPYLSLVWMAPHPPPPLLSECLDLPLLPSCCSGDPKWQI